MVLHSISQRFLQLHFLARIATLILLAAVVFFLWRERYVLTRQFFAPHEMRFSNTQQWGLFLRLKESNEGYTKRQFSAISLPPPLPNNDPQTVAELEELHALVALRTPDTLARIDRERFKTRDLSMGGQTLGETFLDGTHPLTGTLLDDVLFDFDAYILHFKHTADRVRPTILDPTLSPAFPVPRHPAYPSGHSSQAHLIAEILSIFQPDLRDAYLQDAWRVATDREIAGFHYRSDTVAGQVLAQQYFALLMQSEEFQRDLAAAESEWEDQ